ncbi:MAG: sensor histidine kinase [Candidatus Eremiobacteraeota bacterium]|nr:sensor histidine kinase [Candidatus Eremiobacteraeota bacterium]
MRRVVHEIGNHLAIAVASIEAFRDGLLEPSPEWLEAVLQALREVDALLEELAPEHSSGEPVLAASARPINVCAVVTNEVLAFEATALKHGIAFSVERCMVHDPACVNFDGDPIRIAEIVNNVISNAIRYTPSGGRIDIDCRRSGGALTLSVTDGGPGVRDDEIERIFDAGFRGSASGNTAGSGLGLALVKRFVEEHGGRIDVENVAERGARFTVHLPGTAIDARLAEDGTVSLL